MKVSCKYIHYFVSNSAEGKTGRQTYKACSTAKNITFFYDVGGGNKPIHCCFSPERNRFKVNAFWSSSEIGPTLFFMFLYCPPSLDSSFSLDVKHIAIIIVALSMNDTE